MNRTSSFIGVSTIVSILTGVIVLKEAVSVFQLLGAAVIIAGGIYREFQNECTGAVTRKAAGRILYS
mgnify:FL=1